MNPNYFLSFHEHAFKLAEKYQSKVTVLNRDGELGVQQEENISDSKNKCMLLFKQFLQQIDEIYNEYLDELYEFSRFIPYLPRELIINIHEDRKFFKLVNSINNQTDCYKNIIILSQLVQWNINKNFEQINPLIHDFIQAGIVMKLNRIIANSYDIDMIISCYICFSSFFKLKDKNINDIIDKCNVLNSIINRFVNDIETELFVHDLEILNTFSSIYPQHNIRIVSPIERIIKSLIVSFDIWILASELFLKLLKTFDPVYKNKYVQKNLFESIIFHLNETDDPNSISTILQVIMFLTFSDTSSEFLSISRILYDLNILNILLNYTIQAYIDIVLTIVSNMAFLSEEIANEIFQLGYIDIAYQSVNDGSMSEKISSGYLICNMLHKINDYTLNLLLQKEIISILSQLIDIGDENFVFVILESIIDILQRIKNKEIVCLFQNEQFVHRLELIQTNDEFQDHHCIQSSCDYLLDLLSNDLIE